MSNAEYGTVEYNGKALELTQQPYLDGTYDNPVYRASATDVDGNLYLVIWQAYPDWQERLADGDESDCADWDDYTVTEG